MALLAPQFWWYMLEVELERRETIDLCRRALSVLPKAYEFEPTIDPNFEIIVKTIGSWHQTREFVWLKTSILPGSYTRIDVSSQPASYFFGVSANNSRSNVEDILRYFQAHIEPARIVHIVRIRPVDYPRGGMDAFEK